MLGPFYLNFSAFMLLVTMLVSDPVWANAAPPVFLPHTELSAKPCEQPSLEIGPELMIYQDHTGALSAPELFAAPELFERYEATRGLGFSKGQVWVRVPVENSSAQACARWVVVKPGVQEHIVLHRISDDGDYTKTGGGGPVAERPVQTGRFAVFPLTLPPYSNQELLLSFRGNDVMLFQIKFWSPSTYVDFLHFNDVTRYLILGSISLVLATSIIGAQLLRNPRFLFAALAWLAALAYQLVRDNYLVYWFPTPSIDQKQLLSLTGVLFIGAKYLFVLGYMPSGAFGARTQKIIKYNGMLAFIISPSALLVLKPGLYLLYSWLSLVMIAVLIFFGALRVGRGAWPLLGSVLVFGAAVLSFVLFAFGYISLPGELFDLLAPLAISIASMLTALAIFRTIIDFNADISRVQSELLKQLNSERDQLNRAVTASFKANESKSRFLASVSHDLRQPMYAINLYISTLLRQVKDLRSAPEREENWEGVSDGLLDLEGSAQYLNAMFEALLDLSRLNAGTMDADIRYVSIKNLVGQLEADYLAQASDLGLVFRTRIPEKLGSLEVRTDPLLLERILRNLLVNALRYTQEGGICLALVLNPGQVEFRVIDTGPGIEPDLCEQVFDEFYQVQNSQPAHRRFYDRRPTTGRGHSKVPSRDGGIGLGLSISARLAEKLGTKIKLRSRVGRGSIFSLKLPARAIMRLHENLPDDQKSNQKESKLDTRGLYIVVIDDDFEIRRSVEALLSTLLEAEVYTAEDGYQAAAFLGGYGRVPDLLISDYGLLNGDGIQAIEVVRDEFMKDIPAIIITGDTSVESFSKLRESGFKILYKPTTGPQLIAVIEEVLMAARSETI